MILKELKNYFENTVNPKFYLVDVFSWRGIYAEVAFVPSKQGSKEESLKLIDLALSEVFEGWKGGKYTYYESTDVHFETGPRGCSDMALYNILLLDDDNTEGTE